MKFFGRVGYLEQKEDPVKSGIYIEIPVERKYYGDVTRNNRKRDQGTDTPNDNITVNNLISIVADAYAYDHVFCLAYVEWCGALWCVTSVDIQRPRLILTLGGVYNGPTPDPEFSGNDVEEPERVLSSPGDDQNEVPMHNLS